MQVKTSRHCSCIFHDVVSNCGPVLYLASAFSVRQASEWVVCACFHFSLGVYLKQGHCSLIGKASRTEKYLGACAAGKWVLHKSFLEESQAAGTFVKEESHEWGVAKAGGMIQPLEAAPKTWRLALAEKQRQVGNLDYIIILVIPYSV